MTFHVSEDTRMAVDSAARYLAARASFEARQAMIAEGADSHPEHWRGLCDIGVSLLLFTEEEGGQGGTGGDVGAVFQALGAALSLEPFLGSLTAGKILAGDPAHAGVLAGLADGTLRAAVASEEDDAFYDPACVETRAVATPSGWSLSGRKIAIPIGGSADYVIVSARCDTPGTSGVSLFLLPMAAVAAGWTSRRAIDGGMVSELALDGVPASRQALVGQAGQGLALLRRGLMFGTFAVCAEIVGLLQAASALTLDYLKTRRQFGVPIGSMQVLQHRYVDILIQVDEAVSAATQAAAALDRGDASAERMVSAAKAALTDIAEDVAEACMHLHGGIGLTRELPLAQMARRLVMTGHLFGDADFHLRRYAELGRI